MDGVCPARRVSPRIGDRSLLDSNTDWPTNGEHVLEERRGDKFNFAKLASGTCKLARNELCYCIRRPPGISKRKQSSDCQEEWDNWGPRHADPLMRGSRVSERLYCRAFQTASSSSLYLPSFFFFFSTLPFYHFSVFALSIARKLLLFVVSFLSSSSFPTIGLSTMERHFSAYI